MTARIRPRLGDALVVKYDERDVPSLATTMAVAECECGAAVYTAVSSSPKAAKRIIYRKHVKHLKTCQRQAELFALDDGGGEQR